MFQDDPNTEAFIMIGEIGGGAEEKAAALIKENVHQARRRLHRRRAPRLPAAAWATPGAIISGGAGTAQGKIDAMEDAGVKVAKIPTQIPGLLK